VTRFGVPVSEDPFPPASTSLHNSLLNYYKTSLIAELVNNLEEESEEGDQSNNDGGDNNGGSAVEARLSVGETGAAVSEEATIAIDGSRDEGTAGSVDLVAEGKADGLRVGGEVVRSALTAVHQTSQVSAAVLVSASSQRGDGSSVASGGNSVASGLEDGGGGISAASIGGSVPGTVGRDGVSASAWGDRSSGGLGSSEGNEEG